MGCGAGQDAVWNCATWDETFGAYGVVVLLVGACVSSEGGKRWRERVTAEPWTSQVNWSQGTGPPD
jgi:hypothetical protein